MTLLGSGFRRILLLAVIAICVILVILNIVLNIKLRAEIPGLIDSLSKETPYQIEVGKISLDPLFRLQLDKVSVSDPSVEPAEVAYVLKLTARPNIISSLLNQRIVVDEIAFKGPKIQSNKVNINRLRDFIESRTSDQKQGQLVELRTIKIKKGDFHIDPDFVLSIANLTMELSNSNTGNIEGINAEGNIDLLGKTISLDGSINLSSEDPKGEFSIQVDGISSLSSLTGTDNAKANAQFNFIISELFTLDGHLKVDSEKGIFSEKPFADMKYSLEYNMDSDTAGVKSLDIKIPDLLDCSFTGEIDSVTKDTIFKLNGTTTPLNIERLMLQIFGDDRGLLSGELNTKGLKISGSRAKDDIQLTANAQLSGFNFKSENNDDPSVSKVNCDLRVDQRITQVNNFPLSTTGTCSAEKFLWDMTGAIDKIDARVKLSSKDRWLDNQITLSNITSRYMDGTATGELKFILSDGFGGGITTISGDINGNNLNLEKTPKTIIPANISGNAQSLSASFEGGSSNYKADISLAVNSFVLKSNKDREFRVSNLRTSSAVGFEYKSLNQEEDSEDQDAILINGGGVAYEGLSFEEYNINNGTVKNFEFLLELGRDRWSLNMASKGSGFNILGFDVSLASFNESLSIQNSGREGFKGTVEGTGGRYKSVEFPALSWDYNFIGDRILVSNVSTQISTIGLFKTDELFIEVGPEIGGYPYEFNFEDATFTGFSDNLISKGIKGSFIINKPGATDLDWVGNVDIKTTSLASAVIDNISNRVLPAQGGIKLEGISGKFLDGQISGNVDIDTTTTPSGINVDLKLTDASISSETLNVKLPESTLTFTGALPDGALPEGKSNLVLNNIVVDDNYVSTRLTANINARTVAETLYLDQGFIKDINNKTINFSGEMNNSLNEKRTLRLKFPEVSIPEALGVLSPLVPSDFRGFKTSGLAEMHLVFQNLFYPQSKWGGKLSLKNSSLAGNYGGALLSVEDINGTITIKDKVSSDNPLSELMGQSLKLSKSIFQKFLTTFNESKLEKEDLDFLSIKKIDYGILTFENVEVALEVDREKINLRRLLSKLFRGSLYGAGLINFNQDQSTYNFSLLFNEISLEGISERMSPGQEYITGRVNGLVWLTADGADLDTVDGPFMFWSKRSGKEQRRIGAALLAKMGARERLILGSSRSYDNGNISGYINDGLITFRQFEITNSILGITNLSIQADSVRNSITISHLISTVRELSRRSESGLPMIETN